jgi:hypothetical protein
MKNKFFACILLLLGLGLLPLQAQNDDPKVVIPKFIDQWVCDSILNFWTGVSFLKANRYLRYPSTQTR